MTQKSLKVPWKSRPSSDEINTFIGEVLKRMHVPLLKLAYAILSDWHDAEDVVQEAFSSLFDALDNNTINGDAGNWLWTVTRRKGIDYLRARSVHKEAITVMPHIKCNVFDPAYLVDHEEYCSNILACLNELPERERTVIELFYFGNLSYEDIASLMGTNKRTVRNQCQNALLRLKEKLLPTSHFPHLIDK